MLKLIMTLMVFVGIGWVLGLYVSSQVALVEVVAVDMANAVHGTHEEAVRKATDRTGRKAMEKRFQVAELRDTYTPKLEELEIFEEESPNSYPIPDTYLRLLRAKSILPERCLHDDMVGLLKIGCVEREKVDHILKVGWTHIALKVRSNATVDASNPKNVLIKIKGARKYGKRIRELMRQKITGVIGEQRMTVLFKFLDTQDWIMDYGRGTRQLRFYPLGRNNWGFVGRTAGYGYIPPELAGHFYDLVPEHISKHIDAEWRVVPTLTETWDVEDMDTSGGGK